MRQTTLGIATYLPEVKIFQINKLVRCLEPMRVRFVAGIDDWDSLWESFATFMSRSGSDDIEF